MKLLSIVAFNLKGAESDDYDAIRAALRRFGLNEEVKNDQNKVFELPDTTYLGIVDAASSKNLKEQLVGALKQVFQRRKIRATYVISIAKDWTLTMGRSKSA